MALPVYCVSGTLTIALHLYGYDMNYKVSGLLLFPLKNGDRGSLPETLSSLLRELQERAPELPQPPLLIWFERVAPFEARRSV